MNVPLYILGEILLSKGQFVNLNFRSYSCYEFLKAEYFPFLFSSLYFHRNKKQSTPIMHHNPTRTPCTPPLSSTSSQNITVHDFSMYLVLYSSLLPCILYFPNTLQYNTSRARALRGGWRRCNNTPRLSPLFSPHKPSKHTFAASSSGQNICALNAMCARIRVFKNTHSEEVYQKYTCALSSHLTNDKYKTEPKHIPPWPGGGT